MKLDSNHIVDAAQSYLATALAYISQFGWMNVGAAILLVARLIADVPPAYAMIKKLMAKPKAKRKKKKK